jgi:[acyl-carrier-protein] S-malonyltransferase
VGTTALVFAGQGAQSVGMGADLAAAWPTARAVFELADDVLGFGLTKIMFEGPVDELNSTENSQPAVLAMGIACLRVLEAEHKRPAAVAAAGLSLGEYGALVAAGALTDADALRLVRRRGELMRDAGVANPGGMASVLGLDRDAVIAACREASASGIVAPANYNSPGQIVISGQVEALAKAGELCKAKGAKRVIPLKVSGAFHTPLMQPAADGLAEALASVEIKSCALPVVANATASEVRQPDEIRARLLEQLTGTVLFEDSVAKLVRDGVTRFVELGPGKVLSGLIRRIAPEVESVSLGTAEALKAFQA